MNIEPMVRARGIVRKYILEKDHDSVFEEYVVWFCYILGGWKTLIGTTLQDGMYYEVTYNKDNDEIYLDAYSKLDNRVIPM